MSFIYPNLNRRTMGDSSPVDSIAGRSSSPTTFYNVSLSSSSHMPKIYTTEEDEEAREETKVEESDSDPTDVEEWNVAPREPKSPSVLRLVAVFLAVFVASVLVVTVSVLVAKNNGSSNDNNTIDVPQYNAPPSVESARLSPQDKFELIITELKRSPVTFPYTLQLPYGFDDLEHDYMDLNKSSIERALAWSVLFDDVDAEDELFSRFTLVHVYFTLKGEDWLHSEGWLTSNKICGEEEGDEAWFGVTCSYEHQRPQIKSIELSDNNLMGPIPRTLALLSSLQELFLDRNEINGSLDMEMFGSFNSLRFLYLQYNELTGPIPNTFLQNGGQLRTFFLQGNDLAGSLPDEYCPPCSTCKAPLFEFAVDCKKISCPCCDEEINCY